MKPIKSIITRGTILLIIVLMISGLFSSCMKNNSGGQAPSDAPKHMNDLKVASGFSWNTDHDVTFDIYAKDNQDGPVSKVRFDVYTKDPAQGGELLFSGLTGDDGLFHFIRPIPGTLQQVTVTTKFLGIGRMHTVDVTGSNASCIFGGKFPNPGHVKSSMGYTPVPGMPKVYYMGSYDGDGVPNYLESINDVIPASLLSDINATLPEGVSVPAHHPEYLTNTAPTQLALLELCDVYVTFVSEGAGFRNCIGFYVYNTGTPPTSVSQIDSIKVVFPNASSSGSGGNMHAGNKVKIGRYPAGKTIGWVVFANGWNGSNVTAGNWTVYSTNSLNPETDVNLQRHIVLLRNPSLHNILFGVEDWRRDDGGCDNDFNDVVLNLVSNPVEAVDQGNYPPMIPSNPDSDGDGVPDNLDDYPNDATRAFNNYYPSATTYGSVAFEDLWPGKGDYDMNDLVVNYRFNQITNSANKVAEITAKLIPVAQGASLENGFAFQIGTSPSNITSVSGYDLRHSLFTLAGNGTETGQSKSVIPVFDNAYDQLPYPGTGIGTNTTIGATYVTPPQINIDIIMKAGGVSILETGTPPYNPFIVVNQARGVEVHLPDNAPTDKADRSLFGTADDNSNLSTGRYYKTSNNLPWAINTGAVFAYPSEKSEITMAYLHFGDWAQSSGTLYPDWFTNTGSGYRNNALIYTH